MQRVDVIRPRIFPESAKPGRFGRSAEVGSYWLIAAARRSTLRRDWLIHSRPGKDRSGLVGQPLRDSRPGLPGSGLWVSGACDGVRDTERPVVMCDAAAESSFHPDWTAPRSGPK